MGHSVHFNGFLRVSADRDAVRREKNSRKEEGNQMRKSMGEKTDEAKKRVGKKAGEKKNSHASRSRHGHHLLI